MLKRNGFQFPFSLCINQPRAGKNIDAFPLEDFFDFRRRIGVEFLQNVFASLDERDY